MGLQGVVNGCQLYLVLFKTKGKYGKMLRFDSYVVDTQVSVLFSYC